jgi:hypothetical protein
VLRGGHVPDMVLGAHVRAGRAADQPLPAAVPAAAAGARVRDGRLARARRREATPTRRRVCTVITLGLEQNGPNGKTYQPLTLNPRRSNRHRRNSYRHPHFSKMIYIPLTLYPRTASRDISDIPPRQNILK